MILEMRGLVRRVRWVLQAVFVINRRVWRLLAAVAALGVLAAPGALAEPQAEPARQPELSPEEAPGQPPEQAPPERIIITGKLRAPDPRTVPEQVTIITADQIAASAATTAAEILEPLPGVSITRYGGRSAAALVSVRGASPEQVLVLVNGRRRNTAQGGGVDLAAISPDSIERIEVYRGGMSAVHGDAAVGGVINIVLKEGGGAPFGVTAVLGAGSYDTRRGLIGLEFWSPQLRSGGNLQLHGVSSSGSERNNDDLLRGGVDLALQLQPTAALELDLEAGFLADEKGVPGMLEFPTPAARMQDTRASAGMDLTWELPTAAIRGGAAWSSQTRHYTDPEFFLGATDDQYRNTAWEFDLTLQQGFAGELLSASWQTGYHFRRDQLDSTTATDTATAGRDQAIRLRHALSLQSELVMDIAERSSRLFPAVRLDIWQESGEADWTVLPSAKAGCCCRWIPSYNFV